MTSHLNHVVEHHTDDLDGWAREQAAEALFNDPLVTALADAYSEAWDAEQAGREHGCDLSSNAEARLRLAWKHADEAMHAVAEEVVEDALHDTVGGHDVDLRHATRLDCSECGEDDVEAFYLGSASEGQGGLVTGWVCNACGGVVEQHGHPNDAANGGESA